MWHVTCDSDRGGNALTLIIDLEAMWVVRACDECVAAAKCKVGEMYSGCSRIHLSPFIIACLHVG